MSISAFTSFPVFPPNNRTSENCSSTPLTAPRKLLGMASRPLLAAI